MTTPGDLRPSVATPGRREGLRKCIHNYCRCMRANELAQMNMLKEAIQIHYQHVQCRLTKEPQ